MTVCHTFYNPWYTQVNRAPFKLQFDILFILLFNTFYYDYFVSRLVQFDTHHADQGYFSCFFFHIFFIFRFFFLSSSF